MADDPLREAVEAAFVVECQGWASERVVRVTERLQRGVPEAARLETLVIWSDEHGAFTAQGRTIYISRRLLERLADDDAAAFVVAHELAHHRLGHVPALPRGWLDGARLVVLWMQQRSIATPAREHDADRLAIELCVDAGYDAERCLAALEHLVQVSLDYGDVDGVLGAEDGSPARGSHPALTARIAAVRAHLGAMRGGFRLPLDVTLRRERERRRRVAVAALGGAAAVAAMLLWRRPPKLS